MRHTNQLGLKIMLQVMIMLGVFIVSMSSISALSYNFPSVPGTNPSIGDGPGAAGTKVLIGNSTLFLNEVYKNASDTYTQVWIRKDSWSGTLIGRADFVGTRAVFTSPIQLLNDTTYYILGNNSAGGTYNFYYANAGTPATIINSSLGSNKNITLLNFVASSNHAESAGWNLFYLTLSQDSAYINSPVNNYFYNTAYINLSCSGYTSLNLNLTNISLWSDYSGTWQRQQTNNVGGTSNVTNFTIATGNYKWSCQECNTNNSCSMALENRTLTNFKENSQTFNSNVVSTALETFSINVSYDSLNFTSISANLIYDGTSYFSFKSGIGNEAIFSKNLTIPTVSSNTNKSFVWQISLNGVTSTYINSSWNNQSITPLKFSFCNSTNNIPLINFSVYDALNINNAINASIYTTWTYWSSGGTATYNYSYQDINNNVSTFKFCSNVGNISAYYNLDLQYSGNGFSNNYFYYRSKILNNTITEQPLYLLNSSSATITQVKVINELQKPLPNRILEIYSYDLGTGRYILTQMAKTNYAGLDTTYLNWYDTLYKFVIKNGITTEYTTDAYKVSATPQSFTIFPSNVYDADKFANITYSLTFNNQTNTFALTYNDPDNLITAGCLRVARALSGAYELLYDYCNPAFSGTLLYTIGNTNGTYYAVFYATGSAGYIDIIEQVIGNINEIYTSIGNLDGTFYTLGLVATGSLVGLAISPVMGIVLALGAYILACSLGLQDITNITTSAIILIISIGVYLIWKLRT